MVTPVLFFAFLNRIEQKGETGMGKNKVKVQGNLSGVLTGTGCAILVCLSGLAALTQLVLMGKTGERGIEIVVPVLLLLSSLVGSQVTSHVVNKNQMIGIASTAGAFVLVMVIAGLTMEGMFSRILPNIGAVIAGGVVSCVLCLKKPVKGPRRKRRYR